MIQESRLLGESGEVLFFFGLGWEWNDGLVDHGKRHMRICGRGPGTNTETACFNIQLVTPPSPSTWPFRIFLHSTNYKQDNQPAFPRIEFRPLLFVAAAAAARSFTVQCACQGRRVGVGL